MCVSVCLQFIRSHTHTKLYVGMLKMPVHSTCPFYGFVAYTQYYMYRGKEFSTCTYISHQPKTEKQCWMEMGEIGRKRVVSAVLILYIVLYKLMEESREKKAVWVATLHFLMTLVIFFFLLLLCLVSTIFINADY